MIGHFVVRVAAQYAQWCGTDGRARGKQPSPAYNGIPVHHRVKPE
jgi:hypothetical protein